MKLSEVSKKEIVDMNEGIFWGPVGKADVLIDPNTGEISSLLLISNKGFMGLGPSEEINIPWSGVVKIGKDAIIVDIEV